MYKGNLMITYTEENIVKRQVIKLTTREQSRGNDGYNEGLINPRTLKTRAAVKSSMCYKTKQNMYNLCQGL